MITCKGKAGTAAATPVENPYCGRKLTKSDHLQGQGGGGHGSGHQVEVLAGGWWTDGQAEEEAAKFTDPPHWPEVTTADIAALIPMEKPYRGCNSCTPYGESLLRL